MPFLRCFSTLAVHDLHGRRRADGGEEILDRLALLEVGDAQLAPRTVSLGEKPQSSRALAHLAAHAEMGGDKLHDW
jgi:hypothetical protein